MIPYFKGWYNDIFVKIPREGSPLMSVFFSFCVCVRVTVVEEEACTHSRWKSEAIVV